MSYAPEQVKPFGNEESKHTQVERMFDNIAPTYDQMNHLMSMHIDKVWRRRAVKQLRPFAPQEVLDIATGTGDFALLIARMLHPKRIVGIDLSEGMMEIARRKVAARGLGEVITFAKGDCTALEVADATYDAATIAFGIRNFEEIDKALGELHRVLRPGGHLVILELSTPQRFPMKQLFSLYAHGVLPLLGTLIARDRRAYTYLPLSIEAFPQGEVMQGIIAKAGFAQVDFKRLSGGLCTLYTATKN